MPDPTATEGQIVSEQEATSDGKTEVELWLEKLNASKAEEKEWRDSANQAVAVYEAGKDQKSAFNIYHANVETIIPALYNSTPIPDVRRRYEPEGPDQTQFAGVGEQQAQQMMQQAQQQSQAEAKVYHDVAELTERAITYSVDQYLFDDVIEDSVRDTSVTGRGVVRIRYKPKTADEAIEDQEVTTELVPWNRFGRGPGLNWDNVPFIYFEHDLTKDQIAGMLDDKARLAGLGFTSPRDDGTDFGEETEGKPKNKGILKTVKVYEIWDKSSRSVIFVTPQDKKEPLVTEKDPLGLKNFFPTPKPMQFVRRLSGLAPVCPYDVYKPLINEIDNLSRRITALIKELKVRGLYDPKMAPDFEQLQNAEDGTYLPCTDAEQFVQGQSGGLEKAVMHWPIEQIVNVIQVLYQQRDQVKQTIYEIMGVSDIMRGAVDPREKATQSRIKEQSGSRRLQRSQNEVARIARDLFRMKAQIIHKHFEPEVIDRMTGMRLNEQTIRVMRSEAATFAIDIETDSTVMADQSRYQEELNTFLMGTAQIGQATAQMAPIIPTAVPAFFKIFGSFARKFNLGKSGEDAIDELIEAAGQPIQQEGGGEEEQAAAQQMQEQQQQAAMREQQQRSQMEREKHQSEMQVKQLDGQLKAFELQARRQMVALDEQVKTFELQMKERLGELDIRAKEADIAHRSKIADIAARTKKQNGGSHAS